MTKIKTLLFAVGIACLTSPAMAGYWPLQWYGAMPQASWACARFEYAKRCNAELSPRRHRCACITR